MDTNSTTISRVKASVNPNISKKSHEKGIYELPAHSVAKCKGQRTYRAMFYVSHLNSKGLQAIIELTHFVNFRVYAYNSLL